jgi:hypothetical protein
MAIEGLRTVPQPQPVDVGKADHVGATVEALNMLGLVEDTDRVTETVSTEFAALHQAGRTGEAFVQLPRGIITLGDLLAASYGATYAHEISYPKSYVGHELWPGTDPDGYKAEELDNLTPDGDGNFAPHARLAVHNPTNTQEPLLHFLDKPFDAKYAKKKEQTQLAAVAEAVATYAAEDHEGFTMTPLNTKAVAMIALIRRIKGEAMPMEWGFMRYVTLERKDVDGVSFVGRANMLGGPLRLYRSGGKAYSSVGVGLSVGPKVLSPLA